MKAAIFDLDGTLVRLPINYDSLFRQLKKLFHTDSEFKPLLPTIIELSNGDNSMIDDAYDIICQEECRAVDFLSVNDGAEDILNFFKNKQFALGLVTMQCNNAVQKVHSKFPELAVFSRIVTREESYDRTDQIEKALSSLNVSADDTIVIGDRINDMESAKKAGCKCVLVNESKIGQDIDVKIVARLDEIKDLI